MQEKSKKLLLYSSLFMIFLVIGSEIYSYYDEEKFYKNYYKYNPFLSFDVSTQVVADMFYSLDKENIKSEKHLKVRVKELSDSDFLAEQARFDNGYIYIQLQDMKYDKNNIGEFLRGSIQTADNGKKYMSEIYKLNEELKKQNDGFSNLYKNTKNPIDKRTLKILKDRYESSKNL